MRVWAAIRGHCPRVTLRGSVAWGFTRAGQTPGGEPGNGPGPGPLAHWRAATEVKR